MDHPADSAIKVILEQIGFAVGTAAFPMKHCSSEKKQRIVESVRGKSLSI